MDIYFEFSKKDKYLVNEVQPIPFYAVGDYEITPSTVNLALENCELERIRFLRLFQIKMEPIFTLVISAVWKRRR